MSYISARSIYEASKICGEDQKQARLSELLELEHCDRVIERGKKAAHVLIADLLVVVLILTFLPHLIDEPLNGVLVGALAAVGMSIGLACVYFEYQADHAIARRKRIKQIEQEFENGNVALFDDYLPSDW